MARTGSGALLSRRNIKLDSFLKRNTERAVYERIRAHEPCVVISETVNKVYMHAVLSDERVYLTEYPPRTLTEAFSFRRVRDVELVSSQNDAQLFIFSLKGGGTLAEDNAHVLLTTRALKYPLFWILKLLFGLLDVKNMTIVIFLSNCQQVF